MMTITTDVLDTVTGGTSSTTSAVTQQLTALQGSIKDLATAQTAKPAQDPSTMLMMMMALRPQGGGQTVVAAPPVAAAPVINVDTRVRRF
jgi:hypothetical protein